MQKDNRGFSLVELVVAIGILAIVGFAVTEFMNVGVRSFHVANTEVNLQSEAQLAMAQVMDIAIDTNYAIEQKINGDGNTVLDMYSYDSTADPVSNVVTNTYYLDRVLFDNTNEKLWYYRYDNIGAPTGVNKATGTFAFSLPASTGSGELLAENITEFNAWVNPNTRKKSKDETTGAEILVSDDFKIDNKNIFNISVKFEQGTREYEGSNNVTLRNPVLINKSIWSNGGAMPVLPPGTVNSVEITPAMAIAKRGASVGFSSAVRGTGNLNQEVEWRIEGNNSSNTTISNGVVSVAADETAVSMTVYAKSIQDDTKEGVATLNIKEVTGVSASFSSTSFKQNDTVTAVAAVTGYNLNAFEDQNVTWKVITGAQYVAQYYNTFRISLTAPVDEVVTLVATSVVDPTIQSAPISFTIEPYDNSSVVEEDSLVKVTSPIVIKRDGSGTFKAVADTEASTNMHMEWEIRMVNQTNGKDCNAKDGLYSYNISSDKCTVNVNKAFDFDSEGMVFATCYLVPNGKSIVGLTDEEKNKLVSRTGMSPIDKVALIFGEKSVDEGLSDIRTTKPVYYTQPYKTTYKYELKGIENASVTWKDYNKDWLHISMSSSKKEITISSKSITADSKNDTTKAFAYIGSKKLNNSIETAVAPANIPPVKSFHDANRTYTVYLPLPKEKDFPFRTTEEIQKATRTSSDGWNANENTDAYNKDPSIQGERYEFPDYQTLYAKISFYKALPAEGGKDTWVLVFFENGTRSWTAPKYKCYPDSDKWIAW